MMIQSGPKAIYGDFSLKTSILPQLISSCQFVFNDRFVCQSSFHQIISILTMNHIKLKQGLAKQKIRTSILQKILKIISRGKVVPHQLVHKILLYLNYCCFDVSNYLVLTYTNIPRIRERLGITIGTIKLDIGKQYLIQTETNNIRIIIEAQVSPNEWFKKNNFGSLAQFFTPKFKNSNIDQPKRFSIHELFSLQKEQITRIRYKSQKPIFSPQNINYKKFEYAFDKRINGVQQSYEAIQWVRNMDELLFLPDNIQIICIQQQLKIKSRSKVMIWSKKALKVSGVCWVKLNSMQLLQIQGEFIESISLAQYDELTNI